MTDTMALSVAITKSGLTKKNIASQLNISEMSLQRKINNQTEFKASEISALQNILKLDAEERDAIFFNKNSD